MNTIYALIFVAIAHTGMLLQGAYGVSVALKITQEQEHAIKNVVDELVRVTLVEYAHEVDWEKIKELLHEPRSDINDTDLFGWTILCYACGDNGNVEVVKMLIAAGADVNAVALEGRTALMSASGSCIDVEIIKMLIAAGANVNAISKRGYTALMFACSSPRSSLEVVKLLLAAGANVNSIDKTSCTALMFARSNGNAAIVELLKAAGAV